MKQPISSTFYEMDYKQARKPITSTTDSPKRIDGKKKEKLAINSMSANYES